jgi:OOP family OmpA-OmpF porin
MLVTTLFLMGGGLMAGEGDIWATGQVGGLMQKASWTKNQPSPLKDGFVGGAGIGTWLTPRWGVEFSGLYAPMTFKDTGLKSKEAHLFGSALFNLTPASTTALYLRAGTGLTVLGSGLTGEAKTTLLNIHAGAGVKFIPASHVITGFEAQMVRIQGRTPRRTEGMLLASLGYRWGATPAVLLAPAPAPTPVEPPVPAPVVPAPAPIAPQPPPPVVAPPAPPPPAPPVAEPPAPKKIVLDEAALHFPNGKSNLSPAGVAAIKKVAETLKASPDGYSLLVSGHTSSQGKAAFNKVLSKRRADAVAKVLVQAGIPASAIKTVGNGADKPIGDNRTKEGQAKNRRVEIDIQTQ